MTKHLWAMLLIVTLSAFAQQSTSQPAAKTGKSAGASSANDKQIIDKEKALWEAWKDKNAKPFEQDTATNVPGVTPVGFVDMQHTIQEMQGCNISSYALENTRVDWVGNDVAVLSYKAMQEGTCGGKKLPPAVYAQSAWVKKGGKWIAVTHQEVPAGAGQHQGTEPQ